MAQKIRMENRRTGEVVDGYYGFSWTTLFFGAFPAIFRKDFKTFIGLFIIILILGAISFGIGSTIAMIIWAFKYNKFYTTSLVQQGFAFAGTHTENELAAGRLGLRLNVDNCLTVQ